MKSVGKRLVSAITAICLGSMIAPFSVGAVTYDPCDVNHDGTVDISDVIVINQHLSGAKYFRNYSQLDANRSHTVDAADANCVMRKTIKGSYSACYIRQSGNGKMDPVNMPEVSSTNTLDVYANTSEARWYIGYSFLKNARISRYQLNSTFANLNSNSSSQARKPIGTDDRTVAHGYENTGIVRICNVGDKYIYRSTGFIVGDHTIATAAHCLYGGNDKIDFFKNYTIETYDRTGAAVNGKTLTVSEVHIPEEYTTTFDTKYDYALLTVKEDLSEYAHFEIGNSYNMTASEAGAIPIHVTGIPGKIKIDPITDIGEDNSQGLLYTHFGSVYSNNNRTLLYYTVDTSNGQSGAPVYTIIRERYNNQDHYIYTALAVHSGGTKVRGAGPLMTRHQFVFYENNMYAHYQ